MKQGDRVVVNCLRESSEGQFTVPRYGNLFLVTGATAFVVFDNVPGVAWPIALERVYEVGVWREYSAKR